LRLAWQKFTFGIQISSFMIMESQETVNYKRIEKAIAYLEANFLKQPSLDEVAEESSVSPFHFQRLFTEWAGISPKRFLQFLTVDYLKGKLEKSKSLFDIAEETGLSSQSRIYDLFTTLEAVTPQEYKLHGSGLRIDYGFHDTPFGLALLGVTERGICWLSFVNTDEDPRVQLETMKEHWHNSVFYESGDLTAAMASRIFSSDIHTNKKLHVFVKGTNFQVKVWEALLRIPQGEVVTYQTIAGHIHQPKALQAVGSAVGSNHIAYLIPCHRVIRKDGILGEYRWSAIRKKSLIGYEMAAVSR
jgi:AraC family transcriptional regulator, regulatory protein of adaptative response / methylated-DNA-[protein]-cysteine methyltransferase